MITVKITYLNGETDIKDFFSVDDICLDNVKEYEIIRSEKAA